MKRGTRVAQAYTEMHVDGSDMNDEIVDAVDGAQPGVERAGHDQGEAFGDSFGQAFADRIAKKIGKQLDKSLGKSFDKAGKNLGKNLGKAIESNVGDALENVARMLDDLKNELTAVSRNNSGGGTTGGSTLKVPNQKLGPPPTEQRYIQAAYKANADLVDSFDKMWAAAHRENDKRTRQSADAFTKIWDAAYRENIKRDQKAASEYQKAWGEAIKTRDKMEAAAAKHHDALVQKNADLVQRTVEARLKMHVASNLAIEKDDARLISAQEALYKRLEKENAKREANETKRLSGRTSMADRIGKLFGAGSRNNFLNTFGNALGGLVNLTTKVTSLSGKMFSTFQQGFSQAAEGASFFQKSISGLSAIGTQGGGGIAKIFTSLVASGPAAAVAVLAVVAALSALVSVMGALVAIATAFIATIAAGLTAALGVAAGAMLAVVAAGGLLTAAFMSMTDAQKNLLKDAFQPLRAEMVGIGQIMIQEMVPAFATWSSNLQRALLQVVPVAQVMGKAFAEAGNTLTASFSGPGFQAFANALTQFLPSIIARFSMALGSFLNGMLGLFAALMPSVNRFAGYLENVAARFSAWANSALGQNSIASFMDRALVSLQSLWNAVREFSGFIADVLFSPQAMGAGNTIFDGLARTFENLRKKVSEAAANGDLQRWFDDGIRFGQQLWSVVEALVEVFISLYNSGVLSAVGTGLEGVAVALSMVSAFLTPVVNAFGGIASVLGPAISPIFALSDALGGLAGKLQGIATILTSGPLGMLLNKGGGGAFRLGDLAPTTLPGGVGGATGLGAGAGAGARAPKMPTLPNLIGAGNKALGATGGGGGGGGAPAAYKNPYKKFAEDLIKSAPSIAAQMKTAMKEVNRQVRKALAEAATADTSDSAISALSGLSETLKAEGKSLIDTAQNALNSAATTLANASSKSAAKKALAEVKRAQKDMATAIKNQKRLNKAAQIVNAQMGITESSVQAILAGAVGTGNIGGATLAEYAEARERLTVKIEDANQKLADAIAMRDNYGSQVADSVRSFGSLLSAQAQTINGVTQALTSGDITSNLQDRLTKIREFQSTLRSLLAQGLSNDAYKQLVDAGVDGGSEYANAILAGGNAAVQDVNSLVGQINEAANGLGAEASSRLYQTGVDAARGLVDGLNSLAGELDRAAARLGEQIAASLKRTLGIASPSRVMIAAMDDVGDGVEQGLDNQHRKAISASARLAEAIQVTPEAAQMEYARRAAAESAVSGNEPTTTHEHHWHITTPTEDPKAVAEEMMNEMVGRL